jgi:hypothetical protein
LSGARSGSTAGARNPSAIEEQLGQLAERRASLAKAMILLASVDDPAFAE